MNAKQELIGAIGNRRIKCATIQYSDGMEYDFEVKIKVYDLKVNYNDIDYKNFMDSLDFIYGYGMQYLSGYVWFDDGSWLERYEYDGEEYWYHKELPEIPTHLLKT